MNKTELIDRVSKTTGQTKSSVEVTINAAIEIIKKSVRRKEDVTLVGFGTFTISHRKARNGVNPQTGQEMTIPEMLLPRFKAGKEFRDLFDTESLS